MRSCLLQVDLIICFDSDASPIRNIQRMGRTGRHKAGRVVYIMSQGKEEESYKRGQQVDTLHLFEACSITLVWVQGQWTASILPMIYVMVLQKSYRQGQQGPTIGSC